MKDIQTWLGHSNYAFTANTYVHSSKDSHMQMAQSMSENLPTLGPAITVMNTDFPMLEASFYGSKL